MTMSKFQKSMTVLVLNGGVRCLTIEYRENLSMSVVFGDAASSRVLRVFGLVQIHRQIKVMRIIAKQAAMLARQPCQYLMVPPRS